MTLITTFTINAITSDFLSLISLGCVVTSPDSNRTVFIFRSWFDLLGIAAAFWISILKIFKLLQNYWHKVINITSSKNIWKVLKIILRTSVKIWWSIFRYMYKNMCQKESLIRSSTVILVYKLRRVKDTPNFISSGSEIFKRLRRRRYSPLIIERTMGIVPGPSTALYRHFLKLTIWRWDYMMGLDQTSSEETWSWSSSLLNFRRDSFGHQTWVHSQIGGAQLAIFGCHYIYFWYVIFSTYDVWVSIFITSSIDVAISFLSILGGLQIFKCVSSWLHSCCEKWDGSAFKPVIHTSQLAVVTPTDRPKLVRDRCLIELFGGVFVLSLCPFDISVDIGAFAMGLGQILSFFLWHAHLQLHSATHKEKKKEIWLSPISETPIPTENSKTKGQHKTATKNFDYTTIVDRLRTVSWSVNSHPTCVVRPGFKGTNLPTLRKNSVIKSTWHDRKIVKNTNTLHGMDGYILKANEKRNDTLLCNLTLLK